MEVTEEKDFSRFLGFLHHEFGVIVDRVQLGTRANPLSVEILTNERAPVVANYYSVGVKHRNDFEHV